MRYGYAAMNLTLCEDDVRMNRGMRKATFVERGLSYAGDLALENCQGLVAVLRWNLANDVRFFRISSALVPWFSQYDLEDLPNADEVKEVLQEAGSLAREHGMRLAFHPDHFVKLASHKKGVVVERSIVDLENHGVLCDAMGLRRSPYSSINIHIGAHYGDKSETAERFREHFRKLSPSVRSRLTVEKDHKTTLWSVPELVDEIHEECRIPVVYDELHHQFTDRGLIREEGMKLATATWNSHDTRPIIHYSEARRLHEGDSTIRPQSHSDFVAGPIRTWGTDPDLMIEAKAKEQALLDYRERESTSP